MWDEVEKAAVALNDACDALWNDKRARDKVPVPHMTAICEAQIKLRDSLHEWIGFRKREGMSDDGIKAM